MRFFFLQAGVRDGGHVPTCVTAHRARGVGLLQHSPIIDLALTIRVFFAAKLLEKLILHALGYLVYQVLKLLPVPVPAQRRHASASRRLPNSNADAAGTGNVFAVRTEGNTRDQAVKCSIVSTHHTIEKKQGVRDSGQSTSSVSGSIRTDPSARSRS